jgi:MFS transporter, DHA1 family, multidrug resistance protein
MFDSVRDAPLGQVVRFLIRNKILQYLEEIPSFQLPKSYSQAIERVHRDGHNGRDALQQNDKKERSEPNSDGAPVETEPRKDAALHGSTMGQATDTTVVVDKQMPLFLDDGTILVDWYGPTDPANPQN